MSLADLLPRRRAAYIPDDVTFRTKPEMALDQIRRCLDNGIRVATWIFDELYGRDGGFLSGLDALGASPTRPAQAFPASGGHGSPAERSASPGH